MSLAGTRLGPYEVVSLLGSGGMGEVYRARDPKPGRDVAIKVLPASFAADPDRLARFEREARLPFSTVFRVNWVDAGLAFLVNRSELQSHIVLFDHFWLAPR